MRTILIKKYEYLVKYLETRLADYGHCRDRARTQYPAFLLYASEAEELQKQIAEIRKVQKSLRKEGKHDTITR